MTRRLVTLAAVVVLLALSLSGVVFTRGGVGAIADTREPPPGAVPGEISPVDPAEPPATAPRDDPQAAIARNREARIHEGQRPVAQQRDDLARAQGKRPEEIEREARVVVTIGDPVSWKEFRAARAQGANPFPEAADQIATYLRGADGSPWMGIGPLDYDFPGKLTARLQAIVAQGAPPAGAAPDSARAHEIQREQALTLLGQVEDQLLVVGFSLPYKAFADSEQAIRAEHRPLVVEVTLSPYKMPLANVAA